MILLPLDVSPHRLVRPATGAVLRLSGQTMGTRWSLALAGADEAEDVRALVQGELDAVVAEMSQWEPDSELSRFNRAAAGSWHDLSPGLFHVLRAGLALARHSDGAFDPTLGALTHLWGFGPESPAQMPPSAAALAAARDRSGWQRIGSMPQESARCSRAGWNSTCRALPRAMASTGWRGDWEAAGHRCFLIEVGGELLGRGLKSDGEPWWIDCESPPDADLPPTRIGLLDMAVATSGNYRRFLDLGDGKLPHSLDPGTGAPMPQAPASVTVLHAECMIADALATAITVMGVARGLALADEADAAAILLHEEPEGWTRSLSARAKAMAQA